MVVNPRSLIQEIEELRSLGAFRGKVLLSGRAHLIMPYHIMLDGAVEAKRGDAMIGTTRRGIGPAYQDRAARTGLRAYDMTLPPEQFRARVEQAVREKNVLLERVYGQQPLDAEAVAAEYTGLAAQLAPFVGDDSLAIAEALSAGAQVLLEGAQGVLLDIDHGTYPFVTSSSTTLGGALGSLGISYKEVQRVIGVMKAYQTRVGAGPFPTEQKGEVGERLRGTGQNIWDEFGTTTRRPRRCGWLDLVSIRYTARVSAFTELAVTKLDVLSGFERVRVCIAYRLGEKELRSFTPQSDVLQQVSPVYEELPGWQEPLGGIRRFEDLPGNARAYIRFIEEATGLPVSIITVGPEREQTILR
jgi:adenylosuccinate synthase